MARINVQSFDFDGCIFNRTYIYSNSASRLVEANEEFISKVSKKIQGEGVDEVVFMVGSNRQSREIDIANSYGKGSCFSALVKLGREFQERASKTDSKTKYRLDPYLLADTYEDRPLGENFVEAIAEEKAIGDYLFSGWLFDESKLTLLYAQMHKLASENPNEEILYDFYDDRSDILDGLNGFFTNNPNLIPRNLRLRLHKYEGTVIRDEAEIRGVGEIDNNYQENIKLMIKCAGLKYPGQWGVMNNVLSSLDPLGFIEQRKIECLKKAAYAAAPSLRAEAAGPSIVGSNRQPLENSSVVIKNTLWQELIAIKHQICKKLRAELDDFIRRKKLSFDNMNKDDQARYTVVNDLILNVNRITDDLKKNANQSDDALKKSYKSQLTAAVNASLLNNQLDKYNELEKIGIRLLNLISIIFFPIKRLVTGTWFYSTQGKPKEAVQDALKIVNKIKLS